MAKTDLLAPGAGTGIGKKLAERFLDRPDCIQLLENAFVGALKADLRYYDKDAKKMVIYPDGKTRLNAAMGLLAQLEGEPVRRIVHQVINGSANQAGLMDELAHSPALRSAMRKTIDEAERVAEAQLGEVVDIPE
jgi:hypothetical protein